MAKKKILVVDDDESLCFLVRLNLELAGFEVFEAHNGEEGLYMIDQSHPDLIILDVMMSKLDGWEMFEALKKDPQKTRIPVIFLTAKGQREDIHRAQIEGVELYIVKPFDPPVLIENVFKCLDSDRKKNQSSNEV